jgi:hypothetical protein
LTDSERERLAAGHLLDHRVRMLPENRATDDN